MTYAKKQTKRFADRYKYSEKSATLGTAPLWDDLYLCRVPALMTIHEQDLKNFGYRVSGVDSIDRNLHRQETVCEISIDRMFEYWRKGVSVSVIKTEDTKKIYEAIQKHLAAWTGSAAQALHVDEQVMTDLRELDDFANAVYAHAKHFFPRPGKETSAAANLFGHQTFTRDTIFTHRLGEKPVKNPDLDDGVRHERSSLKDFFDDQLNNVGGWRSVNNG